MEYHDRTFGPEDQRGTYVLHGRGELSTKKDFFWFYEVLGDENEIFAGKFEILKNQSNSSIIIDFTNK